MTATAIDTSVAIPLLLRSHPAHADVTTWWNGRELVLAGHALPETYSVLTRLPHDARLTPADAAAVLDARFSPALNLSAGAAAHLASTLAQAQVSGGATYDALVALAAQEHGVPLATRDGRALPTYQALGVEVEIVR